MSSRNVCALLVAALALPALAGDELKLRDLTPVTWLAAPSHEPVEIVREGKPVAVVYVADPAEKGKFDYDTFNQVWGDIYPPPALPRLLHELDEVVRLQTGATLAFVTHPPPAGQAAIVIGDCDETRQAGIVAAEIPAEGFVVKTAANRVYLVGSTKVPPPADRGALPNDSTAWAVADFLERFAGVRWYWRAEYGGRSIPPRTSLVIPPVHYRDQPVFRQRQNSRTINALLALAFEGHDAADQMPLPFVPGVFHDYNYADGTTPDGAYPSGGTCYTIAIQQPLMRHGCSLDAPAMGNHWSHQGSHRVVARMKTDPLYSEAVFALNKDGTRNLKWNCFSAQETIDAYVATLTRAWDKKDREHGLLLDNDNLHVWFPASPGLACNCPACQATAAKYRDDPKLYKELAAQYGERRAFEIVEERVHTEVFALFLKRLCEAVQQRWPDRKVVFYPMNTSGVEGVKYPSNLVISFVTPDGYAMGRAIHPSVGPKFEQTIRSWGVPVLIQGGAFGPSDWTYGPVQYPHLIQQFYLKNREFIRGTYMTTYNPRIWITSAPTFYVWMRALWNPELDVDATLDELCQRLFSPAAETAREFMKLQCDCWEKASLSRPLTAENLHKDQLPGQSFGMGTLVQEFRLPKDQFREIWPPEVVARLKELRDKAVRDIAASGNEAARRAFFYWTWTFDAFLEEAETVYRVLPAEPVPEPKEAPFASTNGLAASLALDLGAGVELKLALIAPGEFLMGSATNSWAQHRNESPQHRVRITQPFYMGIHELTVSQYEAVMGKGAYLPPARTQNKHNFPRGGGVVPPPASLAKWPVEGLSWNDATNFCDRMSRKIGQPVRLPTEAEWEYACRAGTTSQWFCGEVEQVAVLKEYAWYGEKFGTGPKEVGGKKPNGWGLYDLHGNVYEWCWDRYAEDAYARSRRDDPTGPESGLFRILRGGCNVNLGANNPELVRSARRAWGHPDIRSTDIGFRVVVEATSEKRE